MTYSSIHPIYNNIFSLIFNTNRLLHMTVSLPQITTLPWHKHAAEFWFSGLSDKPWSILLHSGYAIHPYSRFDIIVSDPIIWLQTYGSITEISQQNITHSLEDPLTLLNSIMCSTGLNAQYNPDLPFQGGAIGLFGYDLSSRFEIIPKQATKDIFIPDMAIGIYDWALIIDNYKKKISLLSHADLHTRLTWLNAQRQTIIKPPLYLTSEWHSNMTSQQYYDKFTHIQSYLYNGDCYQVNFAQRFQANYNGDEWSAFCRLNAYNNAPFSAFIRLAQGAIICLSPERLIKLVNNNIQTRPIKGTISRHIEHKYDNQRKLALMNSLKDRTENLMIVDLMRNDIGRVAEPGTVRVPELFVVETFPAVYHLVSTITAKLSLLYNACDLLRSVFPGGSITGTPKISAMKIIDTLEPHQRNAWCGSIGYLSLCGTMDINITIRTLIAYNNVLYCSAGGGIIVDSVAQIEYQETFDKVHHILKLLKTDICNSK